MHTLEREQQLYEPVEDGGDGGALAALGEITHVRCEVAAARVLHHDVELPLPHKSVVVPNDVRVVEGGKDVDLALGGLLLFGPHVRDRHALVHHERVVRLTHQVAAPVAASAQLPHRVPAIEDIAEGALLVGAALLEHRKLSQQRVGRARRRERIGRPHRAPAPERSS